MQLDEYIKHIYVDMRLLFVQLFIYNTHAQHINAYTIICNVNIGV